MVKWQRKIYVPITHESTVAAADSSNQYNCKIDFNIINYLLLLVSSLGVYMCKKSQIEITSIKEEKYEWLLKQKIKNKDKGKTKTVTA